MDPHVVKPLDPTTRQDHSDPKVLILGQGVSETTYLLE